MAPSLTSYFRSLIIGSGSLAIRCAEIVLAKQHNIAAVVSDDPKIVNWARVNGVTHYLSVQELADVQAETVDHLFSINNEHILKVDVLKLARRWAINFHDSLLPTYAGTNATSWALMNGETTHGITWHVITDKVDAGDILCQRTVEIAENETASSLNMKCYEAGIAAFDELIDGLCTGSIEPREQNLSRRTFFPRHKQLANGGIISWGQPARAISRLVRSLEFGSHPNTLGKAKLIIEGEPFIVDSVEICSNSSALPPGTIVTIGDSSIRIATADKDILIRKLTTIDGTARSAPEIAREFSLNEGRRIIDLPAHLTGQFAQILRKTATSEGYWVSKLSRVDPASVPYSRVTRPKEAASFARQRFDLPYEFLGSVSHEPNVNVLKTRLLSAYGVLLSRLTGTETFSIGLISAQNNSQYGGFNNLFATVVPINFDIDERRSFSDLSDSVFAELNRSLSHFTYLRDIVVRYPAFSSTNDAAVAATRPVVFADLDQVDDFVPPKGSSLILAWLGNEAYWFYDANQLTEGDIFDLSKHFATLLQYLCGNPEERITASPLMSDADRERLLLKGKGEFAGYPKVKCVHELFEAQAASSPDAIALVSEEEILTYQELNARANRLAHYLTSAGVRVGDAVGLVADHSAELIIGILGVLKAGGTYVALDPSYPSNRIAYIKNDTGISVVLAFEGSADRIAEHLKDVVFLDHCGPQIAEHSDTNLELDILSDRPAYVTYTSGSTGKPKGVVISHRSLVHHNVAIAELYELGPADRVLNFSSFNFDVAAEELFPTLSSGAAVVLLPEEYRTSMKRFSEFLRRTNVSVVNLPTSYWREWVSSLSRGGASLPESLRLAVTGSERVLPGDYNNWRRMAGPNVRWLNAYGLAEATITSLVFEPVDRKIDLPTVPVGRPIGNTAAYILDRSMNPVPEGIPGQLYIGGDGLAVGYLNLPHLTSERFVPNHFDGNGLLYKTGDLARFLPDGNIEFLDRTDNQIKLRGIRIELGEIETALSAHPMIEKVAVTAVDAKSGEKELVVYLVAGEASGPGEGLHGISNAELREYLSRFLPNYMIPSSFVQLQEMPLTSSGKIDRKALPVPARTNSTISEYEEPRDDIEKQLVRIWQDLLGCSHISIYDNFFDLGGQSLLAIRLFAIVEEVFNKSIPLATLFEAGTIETLAEIIRRDSWREPESVVVPIHPNGSKPPLFCIHARGGNVLFYRDLAKHLGEDQPFYAIQARRLGGRQIGHATLEEMAEYYITEIKRIQPVGPYFVGGASFGGLAAFEIAQQLYREGENVALLALFDTGTPDYPKLISGKSATQHYIYSFISRVQLHRETLLALETKEKAQYVLNKLAKFKLKYRRKVADKYKEAVRSYYLRKRGANSIPANYVQLEDQISKAGENYSPESYPGKVILFRASKQPIGIEPDPTLGWGRYVSGELEIHEVPGHHGSIVQEPYVSGLAERLSECLTRACPETGWVIEEGTMEESSIPRAPETSAGRRGVPALPHVLIGTQFEFLCAESPAFLASLGLTMI